MQDCRLFLARRREQVDLVFEVRSGVINVIVKGSFVKRVRLKPPKCPRGRQKITIPIYVLYYIYYLVVIKLQN